MTTLLIPDDILKRAGLSERDALLEFACHLYATERLSLFDAARTAGLTQAEFEDALRARSVPIYRYDEKDLAVDLATLRDPSRGQR
jgi:predicted HTH domain antitoxin